MKQCEIVFLVDLFWLQMDLWEPYGEYLNQLLIESKPVLLAVHSGYVNNETDEEKFPYTTCLLEALPELNTVGALITSHGYLKTVVTDKAEKFW